MSYILGVNLLPSTGEFTYDANLRSIEVIRGPAWTASVINWSGTNANPQQGSITFASGVNAGAAWRFDTARTNRRFF